MSKEVKKRQSKRLSSMLLRIKKRREESMQTAPGQMVYQCERTLTDLGEQDRRRR